MSRRLPPKASERCQGLWVLGALVVRVGFFWDSRHYYELFVKPWVWVLTFLQLRDDDDDEEEEQ